MAVFFQ